MNIMSIKNKNNTPSISHHTPRSRTQRMNAIIQLWLRQGKTKFNNNKTNTPQKMNHASTWRRRTRMMIGPHLISSVKRTRSTGSRELRRQVGSLGHRTHHGLNSNLRSFWEFSHDDVYTCTVNNNVRRVRFLSCGDEGPAGRWMLLLY